MNIDKIIECAYAKDLHRLNGATSNEVVDALNQLRDEGRKGKRAMEWLRQNFKPTKVKR